MPTLRPTESAETTPPTPAPPRPAGVVVATQAADLYAHLADWEELANTASEPNVFYEAWHFLPALQLFPQERHRRFLFLYGQPERREGGKYGPAPLIGFVPMTCRRFLQLTPVCVSDMWTHPYCFLATPLLRAGREVEALEILFDWFRRDPLGTALWRLEMVSGDGPFAHALMDLCFRHQRPRFLVSGYARARIEPMADSAADYLAKNLSSRARKDLRRKRRHLEQLGVVQTQELQPGEAAEPWIEQFLTLEASGWKGRAGTAFACDPAHAQFFREMCRGAFQRGKLHMLRLLLNDRPIAMQCDLGDPRGMFSFKIAYDESYANHSPGVLLELFNIERLHLQRQIRWIDSCAVPNHSMINRLWSERRLIQNLWLSTGRGPGDTLVSLLPLAQWCKRKLSCLRWWRKRTSPAAFED